MIEFEWDEEKSKLNKHKHGLDFSVAGLVFLDAHAREQEDRSTDYGEVRAVIIGLVGVRLITVIYTERGDRLRIISARRATPKEREEYEENRR